MSLSESRGASIRAIGAMVLAAVLLWLGWTAWALSVDTAQQRWVAPIELTPELGAWRMAAGTGEFTEEGLRITRPATMGNVVVAIELRDRLDTGRFYRVEIQAVERLPDYLALGWSTSPTFRQAGTQTIERQDETTGVAMLAGNRFWRDDIYFLSLEHTGLVGGPWTVRSVTLHQERPGFSQLQRHLWTSLFPAESWTQRNPHFVWPLDARLPVSPVAAIAAWAALSAGLMWLGGLGRGQQRSFWLLVPLLIGWLVLDMRWQVELTHKARHTFDSFAGLTASERFSEDFDGLLFDFLDALRSDHERAAFERVFAFSNFEFLRKRARYHLATWAVREAPASALTPGLIAQFRSGDLLLLLDVPELDTEISGEVVRVKALDGQMLLQGQLLSHEREWIALKVL